MIAEQQINIPLYNTHTHARSLEFSSAIMLQAWNIYMMAHKLDWKKKKKKKINSHLYNVSIFTHTHTQNYTVTQEWRLQCHNLLVHYCIISCHTHTSHTHLHMHACTHSHTSRNTGHYHNLLCVLMWLFSILTVACLAKFVQIKNTLGQNMLGSVLFHDVILGSTVIFIMWIFSHAHTHTHTQVHTHTHVTTYIHTHLHSHTRVDTVHCHNLLVH